MKLTKVTTTAVDSPKLDEQLFFFFFLLTENVPSSLKLLLKKEPKVFVKPLLNRNTTEREKSCNWIPFVSDFLFNFHKKRNNLMLIAWRG